MSMISLVCTKLNEITDYIIYLLEDYKYDEKEIYDDILQTRTNVNTINGYYDKIADFSLKFVRCKTQM